MFARAVLILLALLTLPQLAVAESLEDTYKAKVGALGSTDGDADAHFQLAQWCHSNGLNGHMREQLERTIAIDPANEPAHRLLGDERVNGKWYHGDDAMIAKGMVQYQGKWVTKEFADNTDKGLVQYLGKWVTPEEMYKAKGLVKYHGTWISAARMKTIEKRQEEARARSKFASDWKNAWVYQTKEGHFEIHSNLSAQQVAEIGLAIEQCYAELAQVFSAKAAISLVPIEVYADQQQFLEYSAAAQLPMKGNVLGYFYSYGKALGIRCFYAGSLDRTLSTLFHECTHLVIHQACGSVEVPIWANEGLAVFFESVERDEKGMHLQTIPWDRLWQLREIIKRGEVSLDNLCSLHGMSQYSAIYYPQGWSLIYYLLYADKGKHRPEFEAFYDQLTHGKFDGDGLGLFKRSFRVSPDELKSQWLAYFAELEPKTTAELVSACHAEYTEWLDFDAALDYADKALKSVKTKDDKVLLCNARLYLTLGQWLGAGKDGDESYAKSVGFFEQLYPPPGKDGKSVLPRTFKYTTRYALDRLAFAKACIGAKRYDQAQDIIDDLLAKKEYEFDGDAYSCLALLAVAADDPAFHSIEVAKVNAQIADDLGADQDNKYVHALIEVADGHVDKAAAFLNEAAARDEFGFGGQFYRRELARLVNGVRRKQAALAAPAPLPAPAPAPAPGPAPAPAPPAPGK
jgi:hypothetical protein